MLKKLSELLDEWFDRLSWAAFWVTIVAIVFMLYTNHKQASAVGVATSHSSATRMKLAASLAQRPKDLEEALVKSRKLLENKKLTEVVATAKNILQKYPQESFAYVYLARAYRKLGQLEESLQTYRQAVELNPDFVDRRSPDKIGPELKNLVQEAIIKTKTEEFQRRPDNKAVLKALYYLQRRLAGGCE